MSVFAQMLESNPGKYPAKMGLAWDDTEQKQLLKSIAKGKSLSDIAKEHERTIGGIEARLRHIAFEYYNKDYSIDDIEQLTGLDKDVIGKSIARRVYNKENTRSKVKTSVKKEYKKTPETDNEIINTLNGIKASIDRLIVLLEKQQN